MTTDLHELRLPLSAQIRARKLSPVELLEALIQRVEQYDDETRAFITRTFDLARRQARAAEAEIAAGRYRGALHGIPFALKDIYDTQGILTSGHSRVFIDRVPGRRHHDVQALRRRRHAARQAGHPRDGARRASFDLPWPPARNPWNLAHFTGGSSSGSGAAVAAAWSRWPSARTPEDRSAARRRSAASWAHADVRPGEPSRCHHELVHVRSLRAAGPDRRGLCPDARGLAGYDPRDAEAGPPIPATTERSAKTCAGSGSACCATTGRRTSRRPRTSARHGRGPRRPATTRRRARGLSRAAARQLLRRQDHHRREARSSRSTRRT